MRTEGSVDINRPIDGVFERTVDHVADWSTIVVEEEVIEKKPDGVGTTFRSVTEERGKRMEFQGVVTKHDPPFLNAIEMTGEMFDLEVEYTFKDLEGNTRVTQRSKVAAKGFFKVMLFAIGWMMKKANCKALEKELNCLRVYCEENLPADSNRS